MTTNTPSVTVLTEQLEPAYRDFISNRPGATLYHTLEWRDLLAGTYGYQPMYLVALENTSVVGVLPIFVVKSLLGGTRLVGLPFSHRVPLLSTSESARTALLDAAYQALHKTSARYLQLRHGPGLGGSDRILDSEPMYLTTLNIDQPLSDLEKGLSSSVRRAIRKARASDLRVTIDADLSDIEAFDRLELITRKRQGSPPNPSRMFQVMRDVFASSGTIELYLAWLDERPIAGLLMTYFNGRATYAYGGSLTDPAALRTRPNNLLFWTAIERAVALQCTIFDFGSTHPGNTGLLRFKGGWGGSHQPLPYQYILARPGPIPVVQRDSVAVRSVQRVLRHTPLPLLKRIGPMILQQLG